MIIPLVILPLLLFMLVMLLLMAILLLLTIPLDLSSNFGLKNLGQSHYFLDIEAIRTGSDLPLPQSKYITNLLTRAKMEGAKPCSSPTQNAKSLSFADDSFGPDSFSDPSLHRSIVCYAISYK